MEVKLGPDQRISCKPPVNKPFKSRRKIKGHRGDPYYGRKRQPWEKEMSQEQTVARDTDLAKEA